MKLVSCLPDFRRSLISVLSLNNFKSKKTFAVFLPRKRQVKMCFLYDCDCKTGLYPLYQFVLT
jgi:hypothetical protein